MNNESGEKPYDAAEVLEREVLRFQATNVFSPLYVTNFYSQAAVVLQEVKVQRATQALLRKMADAIDERLKIEDRSGLPIERVQNALLGLIMTLEKAKRQIAALKEENAALKLAKPSQQE